MRVLDSALGPTQFMFNFANVTVACIYLYLFTDNLESSRAMWQQVTNSQRT